ncbi:hypothetical protein, partial [Haemophilus influenzae]|uniref:hypothetical protein n=1 Tax=Haemophilus influenzae TaxID=727 RepID=UPI0019551468
MAEIWVSPTFFSLILIFSDEPETLICSNCSEALLFWLVGYAVRGVDENRVGIMVDGLRQAETLSSQGFK